MKRHRVIMPVIAGQESEMEPLHQTKKLSYWEMFKKYFPLLLVALLGGTVAAAIKSREDDVPAPNQNPNPEPAHRPSSRAHVVFDRHRGESQSAYNERATGMHLVDWEQGKREIGKWEPKAAFEARTGRKGRPD